MSAIDKWFHSLPWPCRSSAFARNSCHSVFPQEAQSSVISSSKWQEHFWSSLRELLLCSVSLSIPALVSFIKAVWDTLDHGYLFDPRYLLAWVYKCKYFNNFLFLTVFSSKSLDTRIHGSVLNCVLILLVTFARVWWAHFFLYRFMAFVSTQPRFPSSNPADLNFCQGVGGCLLIFG